MRVRQDKFSVEAGNILLEVERHFSAGGSSDSAGIVMGCAMIRAGLARIANIAITLNDKQLIEELLRLGALRRNE